MEFVKLNNSWWKIEEGTPFNSATVSDYFNNKKTGVDVTKLPRKTAADWVNLGWYNTEAHNTAYKTGWLAPDGKFYGCPTLMHKELALLTFNKTERELEKYGFGDRNFLFRLTPVTNPISS